MRVLSVYLNASFCLGCKKKAVSGLNATVAVVEVASLTAWEKGDVDAPNASV